VELVELVIAHQVTLPIVFVRFGHALVSLLCPTMQAVAVNELVNVPGRLHGASEELVVQKTLPGV
jgi:hypothetical protein